MWLNLRSFTWSKPKLIVRITSPALSGRWKYPFSQSL
jgi:hypothetical protein